jgi:hypothetical protein
VTDFVHPDSFIPPTEASFGWMLADRAAMKEQPSGSATVALTGRTSLPVALLARCGAGPNAPSHTFGAAFPSGSFFPVMAGDGEGQRRSGLFWRCDGR